MEIKISLDVSIDTVHFNSAYTISQTIMKQYLEEDYLPYSLKDEIEIETKNLIKGILKEITL